MAAYLEQIGKVALEREGQADAMGPIGEIAHREPLVSAPLPDESGADDVNGVTWQIEPTIGEKVGVGQIGSKKRVVVLDRRAQKERSAIVDQQLQARKEARVVVEQSLRAGFTRRDVAVMVEHAEGIAVLEGARAPLLQRGRRWDVELHRGHRRCDEGFSRRITLVHRSMTKRPGPLPDRQDPRRDLLPADRRTGRVKGRAWSSASYTRPRSPAPCVPP